MASIAHYRQKLRDRGIRDLIIGRLQWYKILFQMDNWYIGRMIEFMGNKVTIDGIKLDVDNPLIMTMHKSTMFFGIYENAERDLTARYLDRSLPTIEFGGCIGGVSCAVNRLLAYPASHVVVECSPMLLPTLRKNRDLNGAQFNIEPVALAHGTDTVSFGVADSMAGSVFRTKNEQVTVRATTLAKLISKYQFKTINLVSDCEGAEIGLTDHELDIMRDHVKWFIVEIHPEYVGAEAIDKMLSDLASVGFVIRERSRESVLALENTRLNG